MIVKASGRSALILIAGAWMSFAGPAQAATGGDATAASAKSQGTAAGAPIALNKYTKHSSRHGKRYAHRKSSMTADKSSTDSPADGNTGVKEPGVKEPGGDANLAAVPESVANANAQLGSNDRPNKNTNVAPGAASDKAQEAPGNQADTPPAPQTQVVSSDQLNEVDRALQESKPSEESRPPAQESKPPALTLAMISAQPSAASGSIENSTWDKTSLIGKIFIGFGAMLTMASAARMFMA